jgi:anaerobic selenocysteine-containing dehydrogenase
MTLEMWEILQVYKVSYTSVMSKHLSVCPLDCPDTCSVLITVEDGKVTKLEGNPNHPITKGFACVKMVKYPERQNREDRLLYPQKRVGKKGEGKFVRVSWEEALDDIANRTREIVDIHGGEAVLPYCYAGTMGWIERDHPLAFFRAIGASELDQTICASTGGAGWEANYGPAKMGVDPEDIPHAKFIILWGINAMRSNSHLAPVLKEARKNGAYILHIDPYKNETSGQADEHWQVKPGTDAALALAIGHVILREGLEDESYLEQHANDLSDYREAVKEWTPERAAEFCNLGAKRIEEIAIQFAKVKASFIRIGYGMSRNEGGGNATRAITLLPALTGAWQYKGGGANISTSGGFMLNKSRYDGKHLLKPGVRVINQSQLASALELGQNIHHREESSTGRIMPLSLTESDDNEILPPVDSSFTKTHRENSQNEKSIRALFVFNSNPAVVAPDSSRVRQGLEREDLFTVVLEHFQTDTADYADYLLPATTFLEHPDIYSAYGHYYLQWAEPIIEPRGECKPNTWVFKELAKRLGLQNETLYWSAEDIVRDLLNTEHPFVKGMTFEELREKRFIKMQFPQDWKPYNEGSHFSDKKIRFSPPPRQLTFEEQPTEEFPLRLISPPGSHVLNTSMGNIESLLRAAGGEPQMIVHPFDAEKYGIKDGERNVFSSRQGSILRKTIVSTDAPQGTVVALGQWWAKLAPDKKSLNDLTSERLTDLGGGSTFGNVVVRVEPVNALAAD